MAEALKALETIDLLYRAAFEPTLWRDALQSLARATGGMGAAMIPITPQSTAGLVVSPELQEANVEYEREWWRHDSRVLRIYSRKLSGGVCCEAELFTEDELARDPLRQEFLRAYGIGAFAAQLVTPLPNFVVAFSVQRALEEGQFERRELETLKLLGKHAARALVISTYLAAARQLEQVLAGALTRCACGVLVINQDLKVVFANEAAEGAMGDGLCLSKGQLHAQSKEHRGALVRLLKSALEDSADATNLGTIAVPRPSGRRPLLVQAVPVSPSSAVDGSMPTGAVALVIIVDPEEDDRPSPVEALRLLGLTRCEARLAALIGAGYSRGKAAEALGIAESTASDTIKQIYSKLDISRQSELVRLTGRLAVLKPGRNGDDR